MDWLTNNKSLGAIKEKSTVDMAFHYNGSLGIKEVKPSCPGCTTAEYHPSIKELQVEYRPGKLPKHLAGTFYHVTIQKTIQIIYEDDSTEVLSFSGKVIK